MSPRARYLSTTVALVALAAAYVLWSGGLERPTPRRPGTSRAVRAASPVPPPPSARAILDRAGTLELSDQQVIRLHALDRLWQSEASRLEAALREAEGEVSAFMEEARASRGVSVQEIQRRSADLRSLGALLRERRQQHSDAAVGLLAAWQRQRLTRAGLLPAGETGRLR